MSADADARDEAEWISRVVVHDDHAAFACLVRRHQGSVRQFLRRLVRGDWALADDLAQETFLRAYRHLHRFESRGRFAGWLLRIAYQVHLGDRRRPSASPAQDLPDDLAHGANPEHVAELAGIERRLAGMRSDEAAAVVLHFQHGLSHTEVAQALGIPLGTAKSLILRARAKLVRDHPPPNEEPKE
jgi:RNA polymerase sigma factor (sigma-70 family)